MPTFRSPRNPNFKLRSSRLPTPILFEDGVYTTDDPEEVRALRRHVDAGTLIEGNVDFHHGGVVLARTTSELPPAGTTEQQRAPNEAKPASDASEARTALADLSRHELVERAEALGVTVPTGAGKKAIIDAIRIVEASEAEDSEGFDPNDPDGS
jgi:hypothetical protein